METKKKRREWVKTAAIILLAVLLVLTFFSQTIMNASLPEVSVESVASGTINARIRVNGSVAANETYNVTIQQTRKIKSVKVSVGSVVAEGDILFALEPMESEELKAAKAQLETMELNYQRRLTELSNNAAREDRQTQKLQKAYDDAMAKYLLYSNVDPRTIEAELIAAQDQLHKLQESLQKAQTDLSKLTSDEEYIKQKADYETAVNTIRRLLETPLLAQYDLDPEIVKFTAIDDIANKLSIDPNSGQDNGTPEIDYLEEQIKVVLISDTSYTKQDLYELFLEYTDIPGYDVERLRSYYSVEDHSDEFVTFLKSQLDDSSHVTTDFVLELITAYNHLNKFILKINIALLEPAICERDKVINLLSVHDTVIQQAEDNIEKLETAVSAQQEIVNDLSEASGAAASLMAAKEALEDRLFELSLTNTDNLDLQSEKDAIDDQKILIEQLTADADGMDITAPVAGTVSEIAVNAGSTAGAESTLAVITVTDRGYTMRVPVTNEQSRQVKIGDTADISNYYYGNVTATLENIMNDPQSMGQKKLLVFRLTGDVEPGANLTLSIGQRSAPYDSVLPNNAIRTDNNGTYVLLVTAKSSPLGNRYVATRADVQVLASDDKYSAVTGVAYGDFVITTSSAPIEAGTAVRMVDE